MKCEACATENIYGSKSCKACGAALRRAEAGSTSPSPITVAAPAAAENVALPQQQPQPKQPQHQHQSEQNESVSEPSSPSGWGELGFIPYTGNALFNHFIRGLRLSFDFKGRTGRPGFWYFTLFQIVILVVLQIVSKSLADLALLVTLVPMMAIWFRRLHDTGRSGIWLLAGLIPLVNLVLIYFAVLESHPEENSWGPALADLD